jgi:hypothetical protein
VKLEYSETSIHHFHQDPEKERWIWANNRWRRQYKIGLVQRPQELSDGFWKIIHPEIIDQGVIVLSKSAYKQ